MSPCEQIETIVATKVKVETMEGVLKPLAEDVRMIREKMWSTKGIIMGIMISGSVIGATVSLISRFAEAASIIQPHIASLPR